MLLVTGGSGFCGWEIVKRSRALGERVRVLDLEPLPGEAPGVEFVRADIRDEGAVRRACEGVRRVIHTVAKVPISKAGAEFRQVNVGGTRNVLQAALEARIEKVVHLSSSAVQMCQANPVPEDAPYRPVGLYARTKMEAEAQCRAYVGKGLNVDIIRPRTVIGAGRLGIFDILFGWIAEGRSIYLIGSGKNRIQFLHSEDLADCCLRAAANPSPSVFNVGSRSFAPLREDLEALIRHAGTRSRIVALPVAPTVAALALLDALRLSPLASWHYLTYHKDFFFDNARAKRVLGWEPRYGNREILIAAYDDYRISRRAEAAVFGTSHRKALRQGLLGWLRRLS